MLRLVNCLVAREGGLEEGELWLEGRRVVAAPHPAIPAPTKDCAGAILAPGFIDIQINGGFGVDFTSDIVDTETCLSCLTQVGEGLVEHGVTSYCPTLTTSPPATLQCILRLVADTEVPVGGAAVLGLHLEGPFLSAGRRGAHHPLHLLEPGQGGLEVYGGLAAPPLVRLVTLAPELPGAAQLTSRLAERGVLVSLGHSEAGLECGRAAVQAGAGCLTHLFNAMEPLHHRAPGLPGLLLDQPNLWFSIIADGVHTHPLAVKLAYRINPDK